MLLGLDQKWPLSQFILPVLMEHLWEHVLPVGAELSDCRDSPAPWELVAEGTPVTFAWLVLP